MKLFEFMKRMSDKQYQHKWRIYIPSTRYTVINDLYICEKCDVLSDVQWQGQCLLSDNEYIVKQIIE